MGPGSALELDRHTATNGPGTWHGPSRRLPPITIQQRAQPLLPPQDGRAGRSGCCGLARGWLPLLLLRFLRFRSSFCCGRPRGHAGFISKAPFFISRRAKMKTVTWDWILRLDAAHLGIGPNLRYRRSPPGALGTSAHRRRFLFRMWERILAHWKDPDNRAADARRRCLANAYAPVRIVVCMQGRSWARRKSQALSPPIFVSAPMPSCAPIGCRQGSRNERWLAIPLPALQPSTRTEGDVDRGLRLGPSCGALRGLGRAVRCGLSCFRSPPRTLAVRAQWIAQETMHGRTETGARFAWTRTTRCANRRQTPRRRQRLGAAWGS
jgi:hypothetical protein